MPEAVAPVVPEPKPIEPTPKPPAVPEAKPEPKMKAKPEPTPEKKLEPTPELKPVHLKETEEPPAKGSFGHSSLLLCFLCALNLNGLVCLSYFHFGSESSLSVSAFMKCKLQAK